MSPENQDGDGDLAPYLFEPPPPYAPPKRRLWLHIVLLLATLFTTTLVGAHMQYNFSHNLPFFDIDRVTDVFTVGLQSPALFMTGLPFSLTLLTILMAHELGHYLACVYYGVDATLPFFLPSPMPVTGTFGSFIRIRSAIHSKRILFDIGIAGPIAGFVVALVVLAASLAWSKPLHGGTSAAEYGLGYPLIFHAMHRLMASANLLRGAAALPLNRVLLHPMAIAAWVGMFATSLNLLPGGQLDGGHIIFSIAPKAHKIISRLTILILLPMAYYLWIGWFLWAILLQLSSLRHPQVAEFPRVSGKRKLLAAFALLMLVLTLTPAPFGHGSGREVGHDMKDSVRDVLPHWMRR